MAMGDYSDDDARAMVVALMTQMLRDGAIWEESILAIADRLEQSGRISAALMTRMAIAYAAEPSKSEWEAQQRRRHIRAVPDDED